MPELFDEVSADEFALPGDAEALNRLPAADAASEDGAAPEPDAQPRDELGRFTAAGEPEHVQEQLPVSEAHDFGEPQAEEPQAEWSPRRRPGWRSSVSGLTRRRRTRRR